MHLKMESFYTQSVNEYYVGLFRENFRKRAERIAALKNREDALQYSLEVRNKIRSLFHLPGPGPVSAPQEWKCHLRGKLTLPK